MSISSEIERLEELRANGTLSEDEFRQAKARVIHGETDLDGHQSTVMDANADKIHGFETKLWCAGIHLTQLLNVFPGAGIIVPIVMWVMGKDESAEANRHGVMVTNWLISSAIYLAVSVMLMFVIVGIPLVIAVGVMMFIFPIIGGLKALSGEFWRYPMTIDFINPPYHQEDELHDERFDQSTY